MEYSNEHGTTPAVELQAQYDALALELVASQNAHTVTASAHIKLAAASEETQLLYSNTLTREKVLSKRCTELEGLLSTARSASDANNRRAEALRTRRQALEDMLQPLIAYIGDQLLESLSFNNGLSAIIDGKFDDVMNDRDFTSAVEEAVQGLSFEISVR